MTAHLASSPNLTPASKSRRLLWLLVAGLVVVIISVVAVTTGSGNTVNGSAVTAGTATVSSTVSTVLSTVTKTTSKTITAPAPAPITLPAVTVVETVEVTLPVERVTVTAEPAAPAGSFGAGTKLVGVDIEPGTYRSSGGSGCYWERLSGTTGTFDDIIANGFGDTDPVVTIGSGDQAFKSNDCGTWAKLG